LVSLSLPQTSKIRQTAAIKVDTAIISLDNPESDHSSLHVGTNVLLSLNMPLKETVFPDCGLATMIPVLDVADI
jgi:hypothetical protein